MRFGLKKQPAFGYHQAMYKAVLTLLVGLMLSLGEAASALTFKSDGSVIQNSGEVVQETFAKRFSQQFSQSDHKRQWPVAKGAAANPKGFVGEKLFLPGTPLLAIRNIKKGDSYIDAIMETNGFENRNALQRYFVANANPTFLKRLQLTESQAIAFTSKVKIAVQIYPSETTMDVDGAQDVSKEQVLNKSMDVLDETISQTIREQAEAIIEGEINDVVDAAVEQGIEEEVDAAVEQGIEEALNDWWGEYIQELIDSGATIIEQTDNSVTYTFD